MTRFIAWLHKVPWFAWLAVGLAAVAAVASKLVNQVKFAKEQVLVNRRQKQVLKAALKEDSNKERIDALIAKHDKRKAELDKAKERVSTQGKLVDEINKYISGGLVLLLCLLPVRGYSEPCEVASALEQGQESACTGLLVPALWAQKAHECLAVDLPSARLSLDTQMQVCRLERESFEKQVMELRLLALEPVVVTEPEIDWVMVGLVGGGALVVGAVLGGVLVWQLD